MLSANRAVYYLSNIKFNLTGSMSYGYIVR